MNPFLWAVAITAGEAITRRRVRSRAQAWLITYPLLAAAATIESAPPARTARAAWPWLWLGVPLALAGYPIGCALLGHKPYQAPPDSLALETVALAATVGPVEELTWGQRVEPLVGIPLTAALFAAKHVVIDGRWRRVAGLALFWIGLGLVRRRSPMLALGMHMTANASGVLLGHLTGRDSF